MPTRNSCTFSKVYFIVFSSVSFNLRYYPLLQGNITYAIWFFISLLIKTSSSKNTDKTCFVLTWGMVWNEKDAVSKTNLSWLVSILIALKMDMNWCGYNDFFSKSINDIIVFVGFAQRPLYLLWMLQKLDMGHVTWHLWHLMCSYCH